MLQGNVFEVFETGEFALEKSSPAMGALGNTETVIGKKIERGVDERKGECVHDTDECSLRAWFLPSTLRFAVAFPFRSSRIRMLLQRDRYLFESPSELLNQKTNVSDWKWRM